eukprot:6199758-Pleurochrysis_carterae.AAC.4
MRPINAAAACDTTAAGEGSGLCGPCKAACSRHRRSCCRGAQKEHGQERRRLHPAHPAGPTLHDAMLEQPIFLSNRASETVNLCDFVMQKKYNFTVTSLFECSSLSACTTWHFAHALFCAIPRMHAATRAVLHAQPLCAVQVLQRACA